MVVQSTVQSLRTQQLPVLPVVSVARAGFGVAMLPSTFMTVRFGARLWMGSMAIIWGIISTCHALIRSRTGAEGTLGFSFSHVQPARIYIVFGKWKLCTALLPACLQLPHA